jgi:hypothetical protein
MRRFPNLVILLIYCKYTYGITCLELCFTGVVLLIVVVTVTGAAVVVILPIVVVCFDCLLTVNWGSSVVVSGSGVRLVVALVSGRDVRLEVGDSVRNAVHMRSISFLETIILLCMIHNFCFYFAKFLKNSTLQCVRNFAKFREIILTKFAIVTSTRPVFMFLFLWNHYLCIIHSSVLWDCDKEIKREHKCLKYLFFTCQGPHCKGCTFFCTAIPDICHQSPWK